MHGFTLSARTRYSVLSFFLSVFPCSNGQLWSSLHVHEPAVSGGGYRWQLLGPQSCLALEEGSWTHWFDGEPLNPSTSLCIKLEWDNSKGYRWRSDSCGTSLQRVICQASGG